MIEHYTLADLEALPTLSVGQTADLKVEDASMRIWISRCVDEGEAPIMLEIYDGHRWKEAATAQNEITVMREA